jgi:hypothetical protein
VRGRDDGGMVGEGTRKSGQEKNTQKATVTFRPELGIFEWFRMGHFVTSDLIRRLFSGR